MALSVALVWTKDKTLLFHITLFVVVWSRWENVGASNTHSRRIFKHVSETPFVRIKAQKKKKVPMNQTKPVGHSLLFFQPLDLIQVWSHCSSKRTSLRRSQHTCLIVSLLSLIAAPPLTERAGRPNDLQCDWSQWNKTRCDSRPHLKTAVSSGRRESRADKPKVQGRTERTGTSD